MTENVVDIRIFDIIFWYSVLVANRQRQLIFYGIDEDGIAQDMTIERQQERKAATINTLEECAHAESHHALTCTREVFKQSFIDGRCLFNSFRTFILRESITRQTQFLHHVHHLIAIQTAVLVTLYCLKLYRFGDSIREIASSAIIELQVLPFVLFVRLGIVFFDKRASTANQEKTHQLLPVINVVGLFKCPDTSDMHLAMLLQESTITTQLTDVFFRTDA